MKVMQSCSKLLFRGKPFVSHRLAAVSLRSNAEEISPDGAWKNIVIRQDSATGFEDTKTRHLFRTALVQRLCSNNYFVDNSLKVS